MNGKPINENIKVGDEVIVQDDKVGVVTGFDVLYDGVYVTTKDGWSDRFGKSFVKKTGRNFDEIENVLRQMRKGDNMTNGEILKLFHHKYLEMSVVDYRPLCPELFTKDLVGITIWLDNGDVLQYYPKEAQKEISDDKENPIL